MTKNTLVVFAENNLDRDYLCRSLAQVFSSYLDILPVTLSTVNLLREPPVAVLVNITALSYAQKYFPNSRIIYSKRFLDSASVERLIDLPEGTTVIAANKPKALAEELIENLQLLGVSHLKYIPYWPGCDTDTSGSDIVVYAGFRNYCPEGKKTYINLGYRNITPSILAEIVKAYDLPSEFLDQFQVPVMKQVVDGCYHLRNSNMQKDILDAQLLHVLSLTETAFFHLDEAGRVLECNSYALRLAGKDAVPPAVPFLSLFPRSEALQRLMATGGDDAEEVLFLRKKPYTAHLHCETIWHRRHCFLTLSPVSAAVHALHQPASATGKSPYPAKYQFSDILGHSSAISQTIQLAGYYAATEENILILGESGTGKELFAQSIHNASPRSRRPFVGVNCAAIPDTLIESELFGYEEGAFTGARRGGRQGLFQSADTGTIFLDEIGDISLSVQSRLLRVLEEREIMPVGSVKIIPIDVRIICATNRDLKKLVEEGKFREDLYYRLKILTLHIPPLRERLEDIPDILPALADIPGIPPDLEEKMLSYSWPGNIRELRAFASNLNLFADKTIPSEIRSSLLRDISRGFFGGESSSCDRPPHPAPPDLSDLSAPALSRDDLLILQGIRQLNALGKTAGRASLARLPLLAEAHVTEARVKARLHPLAQAGYLSIGRTRQGLSLTEEGEKLLDSQPAQAFPAP